MTTLTNVKSTAHLRGNGINLKEGKHDSKEVTPTKDQKNEKDAIVYIFLVLLISLLRSNYVATKILTSVSMKKFSHNILQHQLSSNSYCPSKLDFRFERL